MWARGFVSMLAAVYISAVLGHTMDVRAVTWQAGHQSKDAAGTGSAQGLMSTASSTLMVDVRSAPLGENGTWTVASAGRQRRQGTDAFYCDTINPPCCGLGTSTRGYLQCGSHICCDCPVSTLNNCGGYRVCPAGCQAPSSHAPTAAPTAIPTSLLSTPCALNESGIARYIYIFRPCEQWPSGCTTDTVDNTLNLAEVLPFNCSGTHVIAANATTRGCNADGTTDANNCIAYVSNGCGCGCHSGCSSRSNPPWLEFDLGSLQRINRVVVRNRLTGFWNRIVGFSIGLFRESRGRLPAAPLQTFTTAEATYTFTFPTVDCSVQPTSCPTRAPTTSPTVSPSAVPTITPTTNPTGVPTTAPTFSTTSPTMSPSVVPTITPTIYPAMAAPPTAPTAAPTFSTLSPMMIPSAAPTTIPTPTLTSTPRLSAMPTSSTPTSTPTAHPSATTPLQSGNDSGDGAGGGNNGVVVGIVVIIAVVSLVIGLVIGRRSANRGKRKPNENPSRGKSGNEAATFTNRTYADAVVSPLQTVQPQSDFYETVTADHEPVDDHYDELASHGTLANARTVSAKTSTMIMDPELYVGFEEPSGDGYLSVDGENAYEQPVVGAMSGGGEGAYAEMNELGKQPVPPPAEVTYAEVDERTVATGKPMDDEDDGAYGVVLSASAI